MRNKPKTHNGYILSPNERLKDVKLEYNTEPIDIPFIDITPSGEVFTYYRRMKPGTVLVRKD